MSEKGAEISILKIGKGSFKVLAWSQMHGNESTTTKALFDLFEFLSQKELFQGEIKHFLEKYTLYVIPMLNPDGASLYTRENVNKVDLNRDAQLLSQKESIVLRQLFDSVQPNLCLNLHDQRSIYGFDSGFPATISFLSPAANKERSVTPARKEAMRYIVKMSSYLQKHIPNQVGRYDDSFNDACVGDTFQMAGVPTILFEAGQNTLDYNRENTRKFIFYTFLALFDIEKPENLDYDFQDYFLIPENKKNHRDIIIKNALINNAKSPVSIAIQYKEVLVNGSIKFIPIVDDFGDLNDLKGYREIDAKGEFVLINSQNNIQKDCEISAICINNIISPILIQ